MGYRDDTMALESRCQALEQERQRRRAELDGVEAERRRLEEEVLRQRWRLRARRLVGWAARHKLLTTLILAAVLIPSYVAFRDYARRRWEEKRLDAFLVARGCRAYLDVRSDPPRAAVLLDEVKIGTTPHRQRVCPGGHLVRVLGAGRVPWQQAIQMPGRGELGLNAELYPLLAEARPSGGALVLSDPPGASVFVAGREVGRTPVLIRPGTARPGHDLLALGLDGHAPVWLLLRDSPSLWFTLAPTRSADAGSR